MGFLRRMRYRLCVWILGRERADILCEGLLMLAADALRTKHCLDRLGFEFTDTEEKIRKTQNLFLNLWRHASAEFKNAITPEMLREAGLARSNCRLKMEAIKDNPPAKYPPLRILK